MPHIFVVKVDRRDDLRQHLVDSGIECGLHYKPNHLLTKYRNESNLPVTESCYESAITLPCHVDLTVTEQDYVIQIIKDFYNA
jgi:dTDP-4-amino-4,6-dideoxygalactose transaminase